MLPPPLKKIINELCCCVKAALAKGLAWGGGKRLSTRHGLGSD